jgi:hypothetical protein
LAAKLWPLPRLLRRLPRRKTFAASAHPCALLDFSLVNGDGRDDVDLALRLDVLAVCAVFAFVGAILLGAF